MPRKRLLQGIVALLLLGISLFASENSAFAAPPNPTNLIGYASGKCVDDPQSSVVNNTTMDIYTCVTGALNEEWRIVDLNNGYIWIQNVLSDKCLTVRNNEFINNETILQYTCTTGANEEWYSPCCVIKPAGYVNFVVKGVGVDGDDMCLTVKNNGTTNNTPLLLYDCNLGENQLWSESLRT